MLGLFTLFLWPAIATGYYAEDLIHSMTPGIARLNGLTTLRLLNHGDVDRLLSPDLPGQEGLEISPDCLAAHPLRGRRMRGDDALDTKDLPGRKLLRS